MEELRSKEEIISKASKLAHKALENFGELIKAVVIFGSAAKGEAKKTSDIDVWVIVDDTATKASEEFKKIQASLILMAEEIGDLHLQITPLTEFWKWVRDGSPEIVNYLKYGLPIYDAGFIKPVKNMLEMGLIIPNEQTIKLKATAAKLRLDKFKNDIKSMIFDLRYAAIDAVQAVVMSLYKVQPDPKDALTYLEKLKDEKDLEQEYVEKYKELNSLWKEIEHGKKKASVEALAKAEELANAIVSRMLKLLEELA